MWQLLELGLIRYVLSGIVFIWRYRGNNFFLLYEYFKAWEGGQYPEKAGRSFENAQRAIADKEALLQDARNEAAQRENAHIETKQDRDGLLATLTRTQQTLEVEMAAKDELQNLANELKEKFHFQQQLSEKVNHHDKKRMVEQTENIMSFFIYWCTAAFVILTRSWSPDVR